MLIVSNAFPTRNNGISCNQIWRNMSKVLLCQTIISSFKLMMCMYKCFSFLVIDSKDCFWSFYFGICTYCAIFFNILSTNLNFGYNFNPENMLRLIRDSSIWCIWVAVWCLHLNLNFACFSSNIYILFIRLVANIFSGYDVIYLYGHGEIWFIGSQAIN